MSAESNAWSYLEEFRWWQGHPDMSRDEAQLRDLAALRNELDEMITIKIRNANDSGALTWEKIGNIFGITRQGAMKRWSRKYS